jgi:hypothetical protein
MLPALTFVIPENGAGDNTGLICCWKFTSSGGDVRVVRQEIPL